MTKYYLVCFHVDRLHLCTILILLNCVNNLNLSLVFKYVMSWYLRCPFTFSSASFSVCLKMDILHLHLQVHILWAVGYYWYICTRMYMCSYLFDC